MNDNAVQISLEVTWLSSRILCNPPVALVDVYRHAHCPDTGKRARRYDDRTGSLIIPKWHSALAKL